MAFNSALFLFFFLPLVFLVYVLLGRRLRNEWLLAASLLFYAWGEARFVFIVLLSSILDLLLVAAMHRAADGRVRRGLLTLAIGLNVGLLVYCKYLGFFLDNLRLLWPGWGLPYVEMLLPLGISFFVFEKITYIVDVYRGVCQPATRLRDYLLFVFLFPKLLAGPILKFHEIRAQIERHSLSLDGFGEGLERFLIGLAKKVLIADSVAGLADQVFAADPSQLGFGTAWLGAFCFTIQIYFDFSGYSDMAIGLARMFGLKLPENFNQPYLAKGFTDFWQRWHISLSSWIREYLYIPLGGSRRAPLRVYINLWICFLTSGLWHGANWTFLAWGAFHGVFVCVDHAGLRRVWPRIPAVVGVAVTFLLVMIGWVLFRSPSIGHALDMLAVMLQPMHQGQAMVRVDELDIITLLAGTVLSFLPLAAVRRAWAAGWAAPVQSFGILLVTGWALGRVFSSAFTPFIYFRF